MVSPSTRRGQPSEPTHPRRRSEPKARVHWLDPRADTHRSDAPARPFSVELSPQGPTGAALGVVHVVTRDGQGRLVVRPWPFARSLSLVLSALLQVLEREVPVHEVREHGLDELGAGVAVNDVVCMLPHVDRS